MDVGEDAAPHAARHRQKKRLLLILLPTCTIAVVVMMIAGIKFFASPPANLPPSIAKQIPFPVYIPQKLPGSYRIDDNSFAVSDNVLVFKATDGSGGTIAITEQARPKDFNFDQFYKDHFTNVKTLSGVPFASVSGTDDENQAKPLSIVTSDVWIVVNSQAALDDAALHTIAQSIKRY